MHSGFLGDCVLSKVSDFLHSGFLGDCVLSKVSDLCTQGFSVAVCWVKCLICALRVSP